MSMTKRFYEEKYFESMNADDLIDIEAHYFIDELNSEELLELDRAARLAAQRKIDAANEAIDRAAEIDKAERDLIRAHRYITTQAIEKRIKERFFWKEVLESLGLQRMLRELDLWII